MPVIYRAGDVGAPQLDGSIGTLIALFDACLVNGYGSKSAAGWTKSFSGTNAATYRQGLGSNQYYFHVNDNGPGTHGGREARVFGSELATSVLVGVSLFPSVVQLANGLFIRKSSSADILIRPWILIADSRTFYLFINTGDSVGTYSGIMFGEFFSYKQNDPGRTIIIGRFTEASASVSSASEMFDQTQSNFNTSAGHYKIRDGVGSSVSILFSKIGNWSYTDLSPPYPMIGNISGYSNTVDNKIYLSPLQIAVSTPVNMIVGRMRGLWHFLHPLAVCSDGDVFNGVNELAGKSFMIIKRLGNYGVACIEISDTWDTN